MLDSVHETVNRNRKAEVKDKKSVERIKDTINGARDIDLNQENGQCELQNLYFTCYQKL